MKLQPTPRLRAYTTLGLVGLSTGLAFGSPSSAVIAGAFLVPVIMGLSAGRPVRNEANVLEVPTSLVEGEKGSVVLEIPRPIRSSSVILDLALSPGLRVVEVNGAGQVGAGAIDLSHHKGGKISVSVEATGWGRRTLGPITITTGMPFGMFEGIETTESQYTVVTIPDDVTLQAMLDPLDTNLHVGDLVSRIRGPGSEFSEIRQYQHGDDPRSINWRVSSRHAGEWWVNDRHPERNGDVLLVVDGQAQAETGTVELVDRAVRLAGLLIRDFGRRRFRVGLVTIDGMCSWSRPGTGEAHRRRLIQQLLKVNPGEANRLAVDRVVRRLASRPAHVIFLSPFLDDTLAGLAHSLRLSGMDVSVIEIDPSDVLSSPRGEARALGRRVWALERDRIRTMLASDGIPSALWRSTESPDVPLNLLSQWRTSWRQPAR